MQGNHAAGRWKYDLGMTEIQLTNHFFLQHEKPATTSDLLITSTFAGSRLHGCDFKTWYGL